MERSRWTAPSLLSALPWLGLQSASGLSRLLDRLDLTLKRGRDWVHSPDPEYEAKGAVIAALRAEAARDPRSVVLYLDEVTIYRQPTLARAYETRGHSQPLARRSHRANTPTRVVATLDAQSGQVVVRRARTTSVTELVRLSQQVVAAYPEAACSYVVQDNWPVHAHPDLLCALQPQTQPYRPAPLANWPADPRPAALKRWGDLGLPIQLVGLPTYASWLNPIETLWRKLRQELTHLHRFADDLPGLRAAIDAFLTQFAHGSTDLLRYVGLDPPD